MLGSEIPYEPGCCSPLADILDRAVRYVSPDCALGIAARLMAETDTPSLLVMAGQTPIGILTERDVLRHLLAHPTPDASDTPVAAVMSTPVPTIPAGLDFATAQARARESPASSGRGDEAGRVVGVLTQRRLLEQVGLWWTERAQGGRFRGRIL